MSIKRIAPKGAIKYVVQAPKAAIISCLPVTRTGRGFRWDHLPVVYQYSAALRKVSHGNIRTWRAGMLDGRNGSGGISLEVGHAKHLNVRSSPI